MVEEAAGMAPQMPKHGEFCWSEIASTDKGKCLPFYENVFGWKFKQSDNNAEGKEMEYLEFSSSGDYPDGALYQMVPEMFGDGPIPPAHIALYVSVDDIDASLEKAKSLGGEVVFGPYDIPNVGRFGIVSDPTGANISMITLAAP
ncbi:MAG: VOC family protein [Pyrinomonadaceae bacterium]